MHDMLSISVMQVRLDQQFFLVMIDDDDDDYMNANISLYLHTCCFGLPA